MAFSKQQIEEIKAANPGADVFLLRGEQSGVEVVVRQCKRVEYAQFTSTSASLEPGKRGFALKQLLKNCLLAPSQVELDEIEEHFPGTIHQLGTDIRDAAGAFEKIERVKL